mmetsp:Transcript_2932/g.3966  ORF Transcript_2932/g.3966 Transcript_2932/m.3966 type:complete len:377 (+) Transcript_2932:459-1589(+)|eukprot:CAMPEP_0184020146 /NCGR_PEP_ID=MMETSP0954-20121128/9180_1 /TAXON_ID=627963 /ORGANISM="Aplanochytrium sp, Strain PBS07" /LENGTH=376 /DNA_ID=CAMNT_0026301961 /DNA_START=315 /DNA_END=1445 /DNA_ORIENTATION=-
MTVTNGEDPLSPRTVCSEIVPGNHITYPVWCKWLNSLVRKLGGWNVIEGNWVKPGNNDIRSAVNKTKTKAQLKPAQFRAQYGRANSNLVQRVIEQTRMKKEDKFIDIGSGIGIIAMQVACTVGCKSTGIEVVNGRHACALQLKEYYLELLTTSGALAGDCDLLLGDFVDMKFRDVLLTSSVVFVNNACGTFGPRCVESGKLSLDYYLASFIKQMRIGTQIVAFDRLLELERPELQDVFCCHEFNGGNGATDWTEKSQTQIKLYYYRKQADTWRCSKCTYENPLVGDDNVRSVEACQMCKEDPSGMRRKYVLRGKRTRASDQDSTSSTEAKVHHKATSCKRCFFSPVKAFRYEKNKKILPQPRLSPRHKKHRDASEG